jgi:hypothetical protein
MNWIKKAIAWLTGAAKKVQEALSKGSAIANAIKMYADSPLLDVAVKLTKTDLDDKALTYVRTGLASLIEAMGWADKKLNELPENARTYVLSTLAAEASVLVAQAKKVDLSRQQAITAGQLVYDEGRVLNG